MSTTRECDRCGVKHKYPEGQRDEGSDEFASQLIQFKWYLLCKQCHVSYRLSLSIAEQEKQDKIGEWLKNKGQEEKD